MADYELSFGGYNKESDFEGGSGGGNRPGPGIYLATIETVKLWLNDKKEPSLRVDSVVTCADPGKEANVGRTAQDYIPVPFPGGKENRAARLRAFCARLNLLPDDAWGDAARSYSLDEVIKGAEGRVIFIDVERDEFTGRDGKAHDSSRVKFAGYYDVTDDRMQERWWMVNGEKPPAGFNGRPPVEDI